ncbi:hypothetical protein LOTGIDRAFT_163619 [Lottia gigantea]|uniref:Uncharacterized protein n=1 Tax=Lottia gigantea TaxID=225164 RepID=V4A311_LOTGI|nr:hypothetical protein LOTGIDRAFT_163619 [Lottia gigantea]ESO91092.1 hypothetical protein LOTGIDRAFT_163619 [Lottia gigantea]
MERKHPSYVFIDIIQQGCMKSTITSLFYIIVLLLIMDYTSLFHLLSTLSWNISSDLVDKFIPICNDTKQTFNDTFFVYHDGFSQKSLKQHNCSCHIYSNSNNSRIDIQYLTLINKENTSLYLQKKKKNEFKDTSKFKCSARHKCSFRLRNNGTIQFTENGGISQFLFEVSGKTDNDLNITLSCKSKSTEITHPGMVEKLEENFTKNDQVPLPVPSNNKTSSINIGMILTGIGIFMIFISILIIFIFLRKYRQKKDVSEKVINTHKVSEIIPEKTSEIKSTKESKPDEEDYEFCEITEYYPLCKEKTEPTIPNVPSKPPPTKQESVDFTNSSGNRKSDTHTDQTSTPQTDRYSNVQLESQPIQRETTNRKSVNSNHTDIKSNHQSVLLENGQYDYDNLDDIEDTYNHLENVFSPQTSLNKSFTEESLSKSPNSCFDNKKCYSKSGEIFGDLEIKMLHNCGISDVKDKRKPVMKDEAGQKSSNQDDDNVELRTKASSSSRSLSYNKLLNNSGKSDFNDVVCELVQRSKSCSSTVQNPEMIIIENDLYESMDG